MKQASENFLWITIRMHYFCNQCISKTRSKKGEKIKKKVKTNLNQNQTAVTGDKNAGKAWLGIIIWITLNMLRNCFNAFFSCWIFTNNLNAFYRSDNRDFEWKKNYKAFLYFCILSAGFWWSLRILEERYKSHRELVLLWTAKIYF